MLTRYVFLFLLSSAAILSAQDSLQVIGLPKPDTTGGRPLMQVLKARHSSRAFSEKRIPETTLSNLLWAAFGVNRADGRRTAPSARNWQEIDLYLCTADGVFHFNAQDHNLTRLLTEDVRKQTGTQDFVATAPLNIVYVADMNKVQARSADDASIYLGADCGLIVANVYLFCASEGLATVVRGLVDREALASVLKLKPNQRIVLAQTVGYPKE